MSDAQENPKPRRSRRRKSGLAVLFAFVLLLAAAGTGAMVMIGRPVDAPVWVREKIEARIAQTLPGINVDFGRMSLLVQRTGLARIILWDVNITNAQGQQVAQLSDIEAGLSPAALLRGNLVLREAQVSGAFVTLQRDMRGRFGLALGDAFAEGTDVPDLGAIIAAVDAAFEDERLAKFDVFEADALTVRYEDQRARRGWTADGGRLRLAREGGELRLSGDVALLAGGDGVATLELNAQSEIGERSLDFGMVLKDLRSQDIATQSPALAWLANLDAPISGALRSGLRDDGALDTLSATLQIGAGVLQPNRATKALHFDGARTYFSYDPAQAVLSFDEIRVRSPLGQVSARGDARLEGLDQGWPEAISGQFRLSDLKLAEGLLWDQSVEMSGAVSEFKLTLDPFRLTVGRLRVTDPAFPIRAKADLLARSDGWQLSLDATAEQTTPDQVLAFWPKEFRPQTRNWASEHVLGGRLHDIVFALRLEPDARPDTFLDVGFEDGKVLYNKRLPPITGGKGRMTMYDGRLGLRVDAGQIDPGLGGPIDITGTEFIIPNLRVKPAPGEVRLQAKGALTAALAYLDNDAWQVLTKTGRDASIATGQVEVSGLIAMELRKGLKLPDITLDLGGTARDLVSDTIVPGQSLTADRLTFKVSNSRLEVSGGVQLSGIPATGTWTQPFAPGQGRVAADVTLSPRALQTLGISLPDGMISGQGQGQLELRMPQGKPVEFALSTDLDGLGVAIPQLGWALPQGLQGKFQISGALSNPIRVNGLSLSGAGLDAVGDLTLGQGNAFQSLSFSRMSLGNWLDVTGRLRGRGRGLPPAVEVASGKIDLRNASFGGGGSGGGRATGTSLPVALTLDSLQVTDSIVMRRFRGNFDVGTGLRGRFDAMLGGQAAIAGTVAPRNGASAFAITSNDAGDVLRGAGMLKTLSGGAFRLDLIPVAGRTGTYDGAMTIAETRLRDAPAIGALLDAISIVGLIDQLDGPGIFFSNVDAKFRLSPSQVIVTESSAVGPSMGVSMDGYYDLASGNMDMQGVLSPIYFVNGIGRLIARKGEGLIGFNFNLRGPVSGPRVAVNPLSVFTPGMFRDIFRRPPPTVSE
ncbi:AsmA-like C-terminal region-containing protein [Tropicibacter naphthalenivorans]|uniref:DUF3971 domain-containing protein n=1 Tax=Tropicibacter naphthalenivorans TaxID=441103 RepID=A0A0P1G4L9_9RHOB|nr:AsmA-like C-terminal region-containing protein [Tropicibacter naphthalenivorans]CUH76766.1 hypothetical protein TRN7648_01116 [Tropicibacter naphthalenivorans]SMC63145.1 Protein of unknown function [Tropicibacter naphthalenivorans]